jgi:ATP-binding cassette subfamily C protein
VAYGAFSFLQSRSIGVVSRHVAERLAVPAVLATAQRAGRPETLANQAMREVETIRTTLSGPVAEVLVAAVMTPLYIAVAFVIHWALGLVSLAFSAWAALLGLLIARAMRDSATLGGQDRARAFGLAADAMRSGEAVLAMGMLPALTRQWVAAGTSSAEEVWVMNRRASVLRTWLDSVLNNYRLALMIAISALVMSGLQFTGVAIGTVFILMRIPDPFASIGDNAQELGEGLSAWARLKSLVEGSQMPPDGLAFPCPHGRLVAERLGFGFRGSQTPLLRGLQLTVEPGEVVGIIGASGSGKSTLLRVLVGMYRPNTGGVYLDGQATHQWDREVLARHMGFLPQDPLLSRGTAAEVIARLEDPDMRLVLDAAKRAGAHDTIIGLPLGYATPIAGNFQLSTGQRHRIALARALYGRPKVLVLDELAGSLDADGEAQVTRLLAVLREEGTSVIFTTHRPALLAVADRVLALRNGVLVPAGEEPQRRLGAAGAARPGRAGSAALGRARDQAEFTS